MLIVLGTGVTTAAAAFLMAGVHLFLGLGLGRNGGDSGEMCQAYLAMFSVQLLAGLWRLVAPDTAAAGLYTVAAGLVILALLERGPVNSAAREALRLMGGVAGLLLGRNWPAPPVRRWRAAWCRCGRPFIRERTSEKEN